MQENGFDSKEIKTQRWLQVKAQFKIPEEFQSCHTGVVGDYFLEGHIPAEDIQRLLKEMPKDVAGLSVPGMPMGSPGMDYSSDKEPYRVYAIKKDGSIFVWAKH